MGVYRCYFQGIWRTRTIGVGGVSMKNTVSGYTSQFCSVTLGFPGRTEQVLCPYSMERGGLAWSPPWLYSGVCTLCWYQLGFCVPVQFGFSTLLEKGYLGIFFLQCPWTPGLSVAVGWDAPLGLRCSLNILLQYAVGDQLWCSFFVLLIFLETT